MNYYNELDPQKAAWLRELIKAHVISPGVVDERSIADVQPSDLDGFVQCHFFSGIGIWSYALRLAGWPDDEPVWTGSCPCQPFSVAGKCEGVEDERHLFPAWFRLIEARRPVVVFGEQVSDGDGLTWLDVVHASMDAAGYTLGAVDSCAAGFGAPMRSQRLYFVAEAAEKRHERAGGTVQSPGEIERPERCGAISDMGTTAIAGSLPVSLGRLRGGEEGGGARHGEPERSGNAGVVGTPNEAGSQGWSFGRHGADERAVGPHGVACELGAAAEPGSLPDSLRRLRGTAQSERARSGEPQRSGEPRRISTPEACGPTNGFWRDAEWIWCRDEKWRPTEPGTFPLAHGAPARVLRLRGYGDGIVAEQAKAFIEAYDQIRKERRA